MIFGSIRLYESIAPFIPSTVLLKSIIWLGFELAGTFGGYAPKPTIPIMLSLGKKGVNLVPIVDIILVYEFEFYSSRKCNDDSPFL